MRYALISDLHANLPAFEAVHADITRREITTVYHLGDLVGYAPWPDETVAALAAAGIPGVAGNTTPRWPPTTSTAAAATRTRARRSCPTSATTGPARTSRPPPRRTWAGCRSASTCCRNGGHLAGPRVVLVHGTPTLNTVYWTRGPPRRVLPQDGEPRRDEGGRRDRVRPHPQAVAPGGGRHPLREHGQRRPAEGRRLARRIRPAGRRWRHGRRGIRPGGVRRRRRPCAPSARATCRTISPSYLRTGGRAP